MQIRLSLRAELLDTVPLAARHTGSRRVAAGAKCLVAVIEARIELGKERLGLLIRPHAHHVLFLQAQLLQSQQIPHGQQVPARGRKILLVLAGQFLVQRLELELAEQCGPLGLFQSGIAIGNQRALRGIGGSGCGERQGGEQDADQGLGGFAVMCPSWKWLCYLMI